MNYEVVQGWNDKLIRLVYILVTSQLRDTRYFTFRHFFNKQSNTYLTSILERDYFFKIRYDQLRLNENNFNRTQRDRDSLCVAITLGTIFYNLQFRLLIDVRDILDIYFKNAIWFESLDTHSITQLSFTLRFVFSLYFIF